MTSRLTLACNNRCIFCAQQGVVDGAEQQRGDTLVGGEPGLCDDLVDKVRQNAAVGLQTNGTRLAERAAALAAAGLQRVQVSLHGAEAAVHDYHTGRDGSFDELLAGVAAARAAGIVVVASTVVTRSNFRVLDALARLVHQRGMAAWLLQVPEVAGRAAASFDRVVPRLAMALPFALHAAATARALGLPVLIQGAPLCLLGPFASLALPSPARTYGAVCEKCEARSQCCGVDARYLSRFDADELQPRPAVQIAESRFAHHFAGVGEMARAPESPAALSPGAARRQLPLYGKVAPAVSEAGAATPKKSGEALRELFPDLFEKP